MKLSMFWRAVRLGRDSNTALHEHAATCEMILTQGVLSDPAELAVGAHLALPPPMRRMSDFCRFISGDLDLGTTMFGAKNGVGSDFASRTSIAVAYRLSLRSLRNGCAEALAFGQWGR